MPFRRLAVISLLAFLAFAPAAAHAWPAYVPDTPDNGRPFAIAADADGDVVVAGRVVAPTGDDDGVLAKLGSAGGAILWKHTFDGSALPGPGGEDVAAEGLRDLAIAGDDVVAAGLTVDAARGADWLVTRRAGLDGAVVWEETIDGGANLADSALAMVLDPGGDVAVTGTLTPVAGAPIRAALLKLAGATGTETWRVFVGAEAATARALAVDGAGDLYVGGDVTGTWFVAKRGGSDGAELWHTDAAGAQGEAALRALALRPGDAPVAAGRLLGVTSGQDFAVVAFGAGGGEQWRYALDGTAVAAADQDEALDVAVDAAGDVVAVGVVSGADTDDDLVAVKLDGATGGERWRVVIDGSNSNNDEAAAVSVDAAGHVVVVGSIRNAGSGRDLAVLSLDGATGAERWRRVVDGATGQADVGFAGAVGGDGTVLAAGRIRNGATADGFAVYKLAGATGADHPCGNAVIDAGEACDDANLPLGDGCRPDCTVEVCGDGIRDPQESCDDGNLLDGDCCDAACAIAENGSLCDDADLCTAEDACVAGVCQGAPTVCTPGGDCHDAACDPATGLCVESVRPDGRLCDDGDACTVQDFCDDGICTTGLALPCDDRDPCTAEGCDPAAGCTFTPFAGFESVSCALDPVRVDTLCFSGLPRYIERRLERAEQRVAKAAEQPAKVGRAKRLLKSVCPLGTQIAKRAGKLYAKGELSVACSAALQEIGGETCARALALRGTLGASS